MSVDLNLVEPKRYAVLELLRTRGRELSVAAAAAVFAVVVSGSNDRGVPTVLRGLGLAVLAGLAVKNLSEINEIVADTLLPQ